MRGGGEGDGQRELATLVADCLKTVAPSSDHTFEPQQGSVLVRPGAATAGAHAAAVAAVVAVVAEAEHRKFVAPDGA